MSATPIALSTKDNASGQLQSGINASVTSIPLQSGNGANFPQPYNSTTTSGGTSTTLNCTGISATIGGSAQEGKVIWNKTDGSVAVIVTVGTNSLTTTRLLGGSDNTWQNGDTWVIDAFVATFAIVATSAYGVQSITQYEEALIIGRSTDTLTVATGGRGYNSTTAASFSSSDYVYLFVTSPIVERFKDVVAVLQQQVDTSVTNISTNTTDITAQKTGSYHYVAAGGSSNAYTAATPALGSYAAGNIVRFKANHTITGAATLNVNSLGAQAIKKQDGATALAAGDIVNGQLVTVVYDGTNFQMASPVGQAASSDFDHLYSATTQSNQAGASSTAEVDVTFASSAGSLTIAGNTLIAGDTLWIRGAYQCNSADSSTMRFYIGATALVSWTEDHSGTDARFDIQVTVESVGGSAALRADYILYHSAAVVTIGTATGMRDSTGSLAMKFTNAQANNNAANWIRFDTLRISRIKV